MICLHMITCVHSVICSRVVCVCVCVCVCVRTCALGDRTVLSG